MWSLSSLYARINSYLGEGYQSLHNWIFTEANKNCILYNCAGSYPNISSWFLSCGCLLKLAGSPVISIADFHSYFLMVVRKVRAVRAAITWIKTGKLQGGKKMWKCIIQQMLLCQDREKEKRREPILAQARNSYESSLLMWWIVTNQKLLWTIQFHQNTVCWYEMQLIPSCCTGRVDICPWHCHCFISADGLTIFGLWISYRTGS